MCVCVRVCWGGYLWLYLSSFFFSHVTLVPVGFATQAVSLRALLQTALNPELLLSRCFARHTLTDSRQQRPEQGSSQRRGETGSQGQAIQLGAT